MNESYRANIPIRIYFSWSETLSLIWITPYYNQICESWSHDYSFVNISWNLFFAQFNVYYFYNYLYTNNHFYELIDNASDSGHDIHKKKKAKKTEEEKDRKKRRKEKKRKKEKEKEDKGESKSAGRTCVYFLHK